MEIDGAVENGSLNNSTGVVRRDRIENAIEDRSDQNGHHRVRGARNRHQNDGKSERGPVGLNKGEQPPQIVHARTFRRSTAAITSSTRMRLNVGFIC